MKTVANIFIFLFFLSGNLCFSQDVEIAEVLDSTKSQLSRIVSYTADATFKVDIDFVNMPDKTTNIYFQAPDKFDIQSDGFLMIPKIGMKPMTKQLDLEYYHAVYLGKEEVNGDSCFVIKMIPKSRNNKIVLATLWISDNKFLVSRWEVFTKKAGNIVIDLFYKNHMLPAEMIFSFELSGMNIPLKYFGNKVEVDKVSLKNAENQKGTVTVVFENYQITLK
jgi:hypothetical protein